MAENEVTNVLEGAFDKVGKEQKHWLKVVKVQVLAHLHLVNEAGEVVAETTAQPLNLFPAKFNQLHKLVAKIEEEANKKKEDIDTLVKQVLF